jgi:mRNA-binding protein PUF3
MRVDAFNSFTSAAFGAIAAPTSADKNTWSSSYWNDTKSAGNTSPRTRPDPAGFSTNAYSNIFAPSTTLQPSAVGSRPSTMASLQPTNGTLRYPTTFPGSGDNGTIDQFKTQDLDRSLYNAPGRRQGPDQLLGLRGSVSGRPDADFAAQSTSLSDLTYATTPSHSQRPSLSGPSLSQQAASFDAARQTPMSISDALGMLSLADVTNGAVNNGPSSGPYDGVSPGFQFNPGSQPWDNGQAYVNGFPRDSFRNGSMDKRGSIGGRNSPAGSTYQPGGGLNSPRSFTGTPQPNGDPWSRPSSRDPMLAAELARRGLGDPFVQASPVANFFPNGYVPPNFPQFPSPYAAAFADPRQASQLAPFGIPMGPFGFVPGAIPTRPARDQDAGRAFRSPLLDEFRSSPRSRKWELQDIWGHIVEFCGDQHASRFIQAKLETANSDERARVFAEIEPNTIQLMKDVFGNYVMQKLFEHGDQVQKRVLANAMKGKVVDLSMQMYGCRVVQKVSGRCVC